VYASCEKDQRISAESASSIRFQPTAVIFKFELLVMFVGLSLRCSVDA
jgi:hypothetical protein